MRKMTTTVVRASSTPTRINVPDDAPVDAHAALRNVNVRAAIDGRATDLPSLWKDDETVVVTFLRSFG
jgi:hypothetical protein